MTVPRPTRASNRPIRAARSPARFGLWLPEFSKTVDPALQYTRQKLVARLAGIDHGPACPHILYGFDVAPLVRV